MPAPDLIRGFYSTTGQCIGLSIQGFCAIPFNGGGLVMTDANGAFWLLTVGTDGRLSTSQVTF